MARLHKQKSGKAKVGDHEISGQLCPLCGGRGIIFNEYGDVLKRKLELYDGGKVNRGQVTKSIYEYIFLKYGFNPTFAEVSQFFEMSSLEIYQFFLGKLNKFGKAIIENKGNIRFSKEKRLLQILSTDDGSITKESIDAMLIKQNYKCAICEKTITLRGERHLDHVVPISKGGGHVIENVQWTCSRCNVKKSNKLIIKHEKE